MSQEKRFGRRIASPSTVQIIHELKLMGLRQSLDAALAHEAALAGPASADAAPPAGLSTPSEAL